MSLHATQNGTSVTLAFRVVQTSGGASPGEPALGLVNTDLSKATFVRDRGTPTAITILALGSPTSAYTSGGFIEISATEMPGLYRFDIPNGVVAAGVNHAYVQLVFKAAANAIAEPIRIDIDGTANQMLGAIMSELAQAAPSATPTLEKNLMLLYMALRNELSTTAVLLEIKNDAGTVIAKATLSDDGTTFKREELVSGP